jgi:hypothetical protein
MPIRVASPAEQPDLRGASRILKFVFALGYEVVRRHEPGMYIEPPFPKYSESISTRRLSWSNTDA